MTSTIDKAVKNNTGFRYIYRHASRRQYCVTIDGEQEYFGYGPKSGRTREQAFSEAIAFRNDIIGI